MSEELPRTIARPMQFDNGTAIGISSAGPTASTARFSPLPASSAAEFMMSTRRVNSASSLRSPEERRMTRSSSQKICSTQR